MSIQREAPARPKGSNGGTQSWRDLLFIHWTVPTEALKSLLPAELELDCFEGQAYVGLVPFAMEKVRPSWLPNALALDFLETNVRTYVHYRGKPGVYFFSLEAASWLAVKAARIGWSLPYHHADMSLTREGSLTSYASKRYGDSAALLRVDYEIGEAVSASQAGSIEHFLLERYFLFCMRGGNLQCGQVHHSPYPAMTARITSCEEGLLSAAGLDTQGRAPSLVHYSPGVDVEVFDLTDC